MIDRINEHWRRLGESLTRLSLPLLMLFSLPACAQVAPQATWSAAGAYSTDEIARLVAPVALYPDDLLAIVLPASTHPLQVVQAQRFVESLSTDPTGRPNDSWDDSVVALLNYPEVLKLLNDDLDWTAELGRAVIEQEPEVIAAIEDFRRRALAAGNLRSDDRQRIEIQQQRIYIRPAAPDVIYIPYYDPSFVTVHRSAPAYHYYQRAYPIYYYPYPPGQTFASGFFWGVTSYYSLAWSSRRLHVHRHDYHAHPFYGRPHLYRPDRHYYRRPPPVAHGGYRHAGHRYAGGYPENRPQRRYREERRSAENRSRYESHRHALRHGAADRAEQHDRRYRRDADPQTAWRSEHRHGGERPGTAPERWQRRTDGSRTAPVTGDRARFSGIWPRPEIRQRQDVERSSPAPRRSAERPRGQGPEHAWQRRAHPGREHALGRSAQPPAAPNGDRPTSARSDRLAGRMLLQQRYQEARAAGSDRSNAMPARERPERASAADSPQPENRAWRGGNGRRSEGRQANPRPERQHRGRRTDPD